MRISFKSYMLSSGQQTTLFAGLSVSALTYIVSNGSATLPQLLCFYNLFFNTVNTSADFVNGTKENPYYTAEVSPKTSRAINYFSYLSTALAGAGLFDLVPKEIQVAATVVSCGAAMLKMGAGD